MITTNQVALMRTIKTLADSLEEHFRLSMVEDRLHGDVSQVLEVIIGNAQSLARSL